MKLIVKVCILCTAIVTIVSARSTPFILGADMSWIPEKEYWKVTYADSGIAQDPLLIMKKHKFNYIRLRLFVDPKATVQGAEESPYSTLGYCDLPHTIEMAKRVKSGGFKFLLDFHYSDIWADPGKQYKPVSWANLNFTDLKAKVRSYTKECLIAFKNEGVLPDMVQVGNEIVGGMLWPDGKISNMSNLAALLNAGIDGVKDVDPNIQIMIHSISEKDPDSWLKNLKNAGVNRIDIFGLSYYSEWHGPPDTLAKIVSAIASHHEQKICVVEYADNHERVNDIIYNLPNEKGFGTFVWEPTEWSESLFDWVNNRRETNARIDIFPKLSQKYGNDIVGVEPGKKVSTPLDQSSLSFSFCNATMNLHSDATAPLSVALFTLSGRKVFQSVVMPGVVQSIPINEKNPIQSSVFILATEANGVKVFSKVTIQQN